MQTTSNKMQKKGFTLVELLIVVAILAVLSTATVLILNPAQILQESRDSTRLSDLNTINGAIALYLNNTATPTFGGTWRCTMAVVAAPCDTSTSNVIRAVDGTGWVDINFGATSGINVLPFDPIGTQTAALHYTARTNNTLKTWELTAQMESAKYSNGGGASDKESTDGGNNATCYEIGTDLTLVGATYC
ncbi:MAG: type II secretion system protein [Patescibacteria group bacterium]